MPAATEMKMRRFQLHRDEDETGTSGAGVVAEGCEFTGGAVAITWLTPFAVVSVHPNGMKTIYALHGHGGKTRVVWIDPAMPVL